MLTVNYFESPGNLVYHSILFVSAFSFFIFVSDFGRLGRFLLSLGCWPSLIKCVKHVKCVPSKHDFLGIKCVNALVRRLGHFLLFLSLRINALTHLIGLI
jgi:hypothetical protein